MHRPFQQMPELPYQNPGTFYYSGNPPQPPTLMQVVDYHYNPDLSYPQVPAAPVNWPLYPRQPAVAKEEFVSSLGNNGKMPYMTQGVSMPMQSAAISYSPMPYMMQNSTQVTQVPRTLENSRGLKSGIRLDQRADSFIQVPQRTGTALMPNLPKATKMQLLNSAAFQGSQMSEILPVSPMSHISPVSQNSHVSQVTQPSMISQMSLSNDENSSDASSQQTSQSGAKLHKSTKPGTINKGDMVSNACEVCGKVFQKPYNLKSHMKTHSTERPFKCSFCPKTFARSHDRKRHENLHGGQKNFKCEGYLRNGITKWGCGKKFARSDALARHFRTETGYLCIKQFMDEEREGESNGEARQDLLYGHTQTTASSSVPQYHTQQQQQTHQQPQPLEQPQQPSQQQPQPPPQQQQQQQHQQQQPQQQHQHQQQPLHQLKLQQQPSHSQMNSSIRAYDPMQFPPSPISLPPLLRH